MKRVGSLHFIGRPGVYGASASFLEFLSAPVHVPVQAYQMNCCRSLHHYLLSLLRADVRSARLRNETACKIMIDYDQYYNHQYEDHNYYQCLEDGYSHCCKLIKL